ncbi:MAG: DUF305 domain-containing protein, partial [Rhizobiales bacterium]|nr:DUF305 domain-containing protein [Hyphomicrobiales bacterium]
KNQSLLMIAAAGAAVIGVLAVMQMGLPGTGMDHSTMATSAASGSTAAYESAMDGMMKNMKMTYTGNADVDFVQGMIPHHQGAIEMAKVERQFGKDPEILKLAENIVKAQESEIATMNTWLEKNAATAATSDSASTKAYETAMAGMMTNMKMTNTGDADVDLVKGMIPHHQGAIDMAKVVLQYGKDPEIRTLAEAIVKDQEGEIAFMNEWLAKKGLSVIEPAQRNTHASHEQRGSAYAGWQSRTIKALSGEDIANLEAGRGMGLALAAELNGYPGPVHVLDFTKELALTAEQTSRTAQLFEQMKAETIPIGKRIIEEEAALDRLFAGRTISPPALADATQRIGLAQGELRVAHLRYHLEMAELLSPGQIGRYAELRGYGAQARPN